jgi:transketolase
MAAAARQSSPAAFRVFAILGDGECNEGQVWEAAMSATHYRLSNLVALVDHNGLQIDGRVCDVMNLDPLADKWLAFGWAVQTIDGHNFSEILNALARARLVLERPTLILAKTVKARGLSFAENQACWHGVAPNSEQVCQALDELQEQP